MTDMATINLPYVHRFKDRHGRVRHYYRRAGYKGASLPAPGSDGFLAAYEAAGKRGGPQGVGSEKTVPGSLSALVATYYLSAKFAELRPSTQRNQRNQLDAFRMTWGTCLVRDFNRALLEEIFEGMASRSQASNLRKRLRKVFQFGVKLDWIPTNPIRETESVGYRSTGFTPWSEEDIAAFEAHWPSGSRQRLALALLLYTGVRRSDAVTLGRQHVRDGRIHVTPLKTAGAGVRIAVRIHPRLASEIEAVPAPNMTFLLTQYGKPFSPAGFTSWFVEAAEAAGLSQRTPHGLRKAAGRRLAEAGCTAKQIMAVLGHKTMAEAERYTADADVEHLSDQAMDRITNGSVANLG